MRPPIERGARPTGVQEIVISPKPIVVAISLIAVLAAAPVIAESGDATSGPELSKADMPRALRAFKIAKSGRWPAAHALAARVGHPLPAKIIRWLHYTRPAARVPFREIAAFIAESESWPRPEALSRTAEHAALTLPAPEAIAWFGLRPPTTGAGKAALAEAQGESGLLVESRAGLREAWIHGDFRAAEERRFYLRHKAVLRPEDHAARLDRLLWDERIRPVRRMLLRVAADPRLLGEARLFLMLSGPTVDEAIARVPDALKRHAGLIYERVRWRRRKGFHDRARELLVDVPADLIRPDKWWFERRRQIRETMQEASVSEAYRLAAGHRQIERAPASEAEWLAGWIALRFLGDGRAALTHFERMYALVRLPISRARAGYWAASAATAIGKTELARAWYERSAAYPTTFYGQLASAEAKGGAALDIPPDPQPTEDDVARFGRRELVDVVLVLHQLGQRDLQRPFLLRLADIVDTPGEHALVAALAQRVGGPELAIAAAKRSLRRGVFLVGAAYPRHELPRDFAVEPALVLAVARQESEFNARAISPAGARGLMQLMPATARSEARRLRIGYSEQRFLDDVHYNLTLGGSYLGALVDAYDGSYVLALTAYNAGGKRTRRWIRKWGDPRLGEIDLIDWIELIPVAETRNFVQRVIENLHVYRYRLGGGDRVMYRPRALDARTVP